MNQKYNFRKEFSRILTFIHRQGELPKKIRFRHIDPDVHADLWYQIGIDRYRNERLQTKD